MPRVPKSTREKLLEAAFLDIYSNGFRGGSLNQVVKTADSTKGALFHYFESKQALGHAVLAEVIEPNMKAGWFTPLALSTDPINDLKKMFRMHIRSYFAGSVQCGCALSNLAQEMAPLNDGFRRQTESIYGEWRESIASAIKRGAKEKRVRAGVDPEKVAAFVVAAQVGIWTTAKMSQSEEPALRAIEALCDYLDSLLPG